MTGKILVSTAYLPPVEYFSLFLYADEILIEKEENYLKQSYRNRCYILSPHGRQILSVPVYLGSQHKTPVKEIRIDYSKRWQQVHLGALTASYSSAPYFQYYFENIERIIAGKNEFLIDLNTELTALMMNMLKLDLRLSYTTDFQPEGSVENDYRYRISPKKPSRFAVREYLQVFKNSSGFVQPLSILDLIFNVGPEAVNYLAGADL
jgi:hypothetical protein